MLFLVVIEINKNISDINNKSFFFFQPVEREITLKVNK